MSIVPRTASILSPRERLLLGIAISTGIASLVISICTALLMMVYTINHDREMYARDVHHIEQMNESQKDFQLVVKWAIAVYERGTAAGCDVPEPPFVGMDTQQRREQRERQQRQERQLEKEK